MDKNPLPRFELWAIIIGEILTALVTCGVFVILGKFSYTVINGVTLGAAVTIINFLILSVTATRALNKVLMRRPDREMDEEEAAEFAAQNQAEIQNAVKISYIIRTFTMLLTLVLAFILKNWFDVISTVVPLIMFRPIITVAALIKRRHEK